MIDSVLKGTGNSRFLKSAVPAGTSWADALAMLQAGTFPIDFNGINTEGFQQVGTPLNKANLLKDATAAQIGLPSTTTPDGMFQALANTGELHVWRKTVTTAEEIPAGYTLESAEDTLLSTRAEYGSGTQYINVEYASSCAVSASGEPYLVNSSSVNLVATSSDTITTLNKQKGKFLKISAASGSSYVTTTDGIFFIPSDATFRLESSPHRIFVDKGQKVNGYPATPAGTTTTYPVSTNPNAYQEGDDAKSAGYVLGDVVTGSFKLRPATNDSTAWNYGTALNVAENGTTTISDRQQITLTTSSTVANANVLKGKFVKPLAVTPSPFVNGQMYFIPADATISKDGTLLVNKYQVVTGYPTIPAGTTIEYLGKLGDKARVQVVSYMGTGTYGESNAISLTFNFEPKFIAIQRNVSNYDGKTFAIRGMKYLNRLNADGNNNHAILTWEGKKVSWYSYKNDATNQMNISGETYIVVAIG